MHAQPATARLTYAPIGTAAATVIGLAVALLVWAAVSNSTFPVIGSHDRAALWLVFGLGVTMCAIAGVGPYSKTLGWLHPMTLIGIALGVLAVVPVLLILVKWVLGFSIYRISPAGGPHG